MMTDAEKAELKRLRAQTLILAEAVAFYADPGTYHAISFLGDPPCGAFASDFSRVPDSEYDRKMAGKRARAALKKAASK